MIARVFLNRLRIKYPKSTRSPREEGDLGNASTDLPEQRRCHLPPYSVFDKVRQLLITPVHAPSANYLEVGFP